jgi:hypothetical protein
MAEPTSTAPDLDSTLSRGQRVNPARKEPQDRIQESGVAGVAGVQEPENLGAWRRFSQGDAGPGFSDKDLARVFCNS